MQSPDMPASTCATCGSHSFEVVSFVPLRQTYKLSLVQCSSCGTPVGALDQGTKHLVEDLRKRIASIDDRLALIARALGGAALH
jgi:hypothetical protein